MPKFVALIYGDESVWDAQDRDENMAAHKAFNTKHAAAITSGEELHSPGTARTVRGDAVTDGPFLETKEVLGGYYVLEAPDLDAAVAIAKDIPEPTVEVRPIVS